MKNIKTFKKKQNKIKKENKNLKNKSLNLFQ